MVSSKGKKGGEPLVRKDGDATVMDTVPSYQAEVSLAIYSFRLYLLIVC